MKERSNESMSRRNAIKMGGRLFSLGLALPYVLGKGARAQASSAIAKGAASSSSAITSSASTWASGGTNLISVDYPASNIFAGAGVCSEALSEQETLGPCYLGSATGEDISEGGQGLPMQLCIRLIDSNCNPLAGRKIEVWHCDTEGIYSGDTANSTDSSSFAGNFCTAGDEEAQKSLWYRGALKTDAEGRVNFKSCFPGWYRGRTIHIHVAVVNDKNQRELITQFAFKDSLTEEICNQHPLYKHRGTQDTPLQGGRDTVFPAYSYDQYLMNTSINADGSMLAYHTLQLTNV